MKKLLYIILTSLLLVSCGEQVPLADLVGNGVKTPTTDLKYQINDKNKNDINLNNNEKQNSNNNDNGNNNSNSYHYNDDNDDENENDDDENENNNNSNQSSIKLHHQGKSCVICHSSGEHKFNSGATVYNKNNQPASGYTIRLIHNNSSLSNYLKGRGTGNSYLTYFNGSKFTAKVIDANGNIVNSSATNSHDRSRLDCNRCHTKMGRNNAPQRIWNFRK